jgi:hypothetical protein
MKILALDLGMFKRMCCIFDTKARLHEFLTAATQPSRSDANTSIEIELLEQRN